MGNKTTSIGMSKLLANASKMEKEIKETENVAPTITVEAEQTKQNGEEQPQEVKEVKKVEDFVIAIDTSMSCSGELVQAFLKETYSILKSNDSFFKKVNIHIIQCDEQIQSDQLIENERQLVEYMDHFQLIGNGGTDFRPVFTYVDQLLSEGKFHHLRGLLYFTDGCGIFPTKAPRYQTAFLFMEQEGNQFDLPPWAIQLVLQPEDLEEQNEH